MGQLPTQTVCTLLTSPVTFGRGYRDSEPGGLGSNPSSATYPLCDVGSPTKVLYSSISSGTCGHPSAKLKAAMDVRRLDQAEPTLVFSSTAIVLYLSWACESKRQA